MLACAATLLFYWLGFTDLIRDSLRTVRACGIRSTAAGARASLGAGGTVAHGVLRRATPTSKSHV